jgi:hypothetical protein
MAADCTTRILAFCLGALLLSGGCEEETANRGGNWTLLDVGFNWSSDGNTAPWEQDLYTYPQTWDLYQPPADAGSPDAGCTKTSSSCSSCASDEICTAVGGGTCIQVVELIGSSTDAVVLARIVEAYLDCWYGYPGKTVVCSAFDTCQMAGAVTGADVEGFVCQTATTQDLPSGKLDKARDLLNCKKKIWPLGIKRPEWQISSIDSGKQGLVCLYYSSHHGFGLDRLHVKSCH